MAQFKARVVSLAQGGRGVLIGPEGKVFFADSVWPGDEACFEITKEKKNYGEAKLVELLVKSPERRASLPCAYSGSDLGSCGGCSWMFVNYSAQLKAKESLVKELCLKAKLFDDPNFELLEIKASTQEFGYRNRAQLKTDGKQMGFLEKGTHNIVDIKKCLVLNARAQENLDQLRSRLPNEDWQPQIPHKFRFVDIDDECEVQNLKLDKRLPFRQGNTDQNTFMKQQVLDWVKNHCLKNSNAIEMFCGSGNFTEVLAEAKMFQKIYAVEVSQIAADILQSQQMANVFPVCADLFGNKKLSPELTSYLGEVEFLLVDPPREGWTEISRFALKMPRLKNILYISCDPVTFIRDLKSLNAAGFKAERIQPVDLFPQTPHIELMAWISK